MNLFDHRMIIDYLVVIELLHDVQLTATKFRFECILQLLVRGDMHVSIDNILSKNTNCSPSEQVISGLVCSLLLESVRSLRRTFSHEPYVHRYVPQLKPVNPSLVCSIKCIWFKMHTKTRNRKSPIKFLDCWNRRHFMVHFNAKQKINYDYHDSINKSSMYVCMCDNKTR